MPGFFFVHLTSPRFLSFLSNMKEVLRYRRCFVCGEENIGGLKAKFYWDGEKVHCTCLATDAYEGYHGIYHGGIVATLLDEVMVKAVLASGFHSVTAEMTVRYKKPVRIGETVRYVGWIKEHKGRLFVTEAEALDERGERYATATARFLEAKADLKDQLLKSND